VIKLIKNHISETVTNILEIAINLTQEIRSQSLKKHFTENLSKAVKKVFVVTQELKRKALHHIFVANFEWIVGSRTK
jgi:hypothetical protein